MPKPLSTLPPGISARPNAADLQTFVDRATAERSGELGFIVLFGSMARGDYSYGSDFDVVVGLETDDAGRFIDRLADWSALSPRGYVESFVYTRSELRQMARAGHHILTEASRDGVVLYDRGLWSEVLSVLNHRTSNAPR